MKLASESSVRQTTTQSRSVGHSRGPFSSVESNQPRIEARLTELAAFVLELLENALKQAECDSEPKGQIRLGQSPVTLYQGVVRLTYMSQRRGVCAGYVSRKGRGYRSGRTKESTARGPSAGVGVDAASDDQNSISSVPCRRRAESDPSLTHLAGDPDLVRMIAPTRAPRLGQLPFALLDEDHQDDEREAAVHPRAVRERRVAHHVRDERDQLDRQGWVTFIVEGTCKMGESSKTSVLRRRKRARAGQIYEQDDTHLLFRTGRCTLENKTSCSNRAVRGKAATGPSSRVGDRRTGHPPVAH